MVADVLGPSLDGRLSKVIQEDAWRSEISSHFLDAPESAASSIVSHVGRDLFTFMNPVVRPESSQNDIWAL